MEKKIAVLEKDVRRAYGICDEATVEFYGNGHIHETYKVCDGDRIMILQKMNIKVFPDYKGVMNNIDLVTTHLSEKLLAAGRDPREGTLTVVKTVDGKSYYRQTDEKSGDDLVYRAFLYIDAESRDQPSAPSLFQAGRAFGEFQNMLADFPVEKLVEIIPNFHNTPSRLQNLENAIAADKCGRLSNCRDLVLLARSLAWLAPTVTDAMKEGSVPLRVTHNDTKLNNLLFRRGKDEVMAVIDLDTVMPGSLLYDFGDALRCGMATAPEDGSDIDKIGVDTALYEAFARGFVTAIGDRMTAKEKELLPLSCLLMTYEVGIRFLTDYLSGDVYFRIGYPEHNLVRARNQLTLTKRMEEALPEFYKITKAL